MMGDDSRALAVGPGDDEAVSQELAAVDDERVDTTLVLSMLALTPEQRLEHLQGFVDSVWELRHGSKT